MTWGDHHAAWWVEEIASDPAYGEEVIPLALELLDPRPGRRYLDLGCGEGQVMEKIAAAGATALGCDLLPDLVRRAARHGPAAVGRLPDLAWVREGSVDGALLILVLEHLPDAAPVFRSAAAAVRPGGVLVAVLNHPVITAPGSGPFVDPDDGEVLWRWGPYLESGLTVEPAGDGTVVFHHHPLGGLLGAAAAAGWSLQRFVETGVGPARAERDPLLAVQAHVPRLLGIRWRAFPEGATGRASG